ncbi:MAG: hypothetical protein LLF94_03810 [Chlamydiales bacterium]|nr:hypothetical protein [Chlamydiales bacterium]
MNMKTRHSTLYGLSGAIWLGIGIMLLNLGLGFLMHGFQGHIFIQDGYSGMFSWLAGISGGHEFAAIGLIVFSLFVGFAKGRFVLQKAALKSANRIAKLANPTPITNLYTRSNLILIAIMMGMGMLMKVLALPYDIRGSIDIAVGSALMQGSLAYFRLMSQAPTTA